MTHAWSDRRPSPCARGALGHGHAARLTFGLALAALVVTGCSSSDGRELADPDPDLTATSAPQAAPEVGAVPGSQETDIPVSSQGLGGLRISSPAFEPGSAIPPRFTCVGGDLSPPLAWQSVPDGTAELALVVRSPTSNGAVHWLITDIDPTTTGLEEDEQPSPTVEWLGPCPTPGTRQQYVFSLYPLREPLDPAPTLRPDEVASLVEGVAPAPATLTATFTR